MSSDKLLCSFFSEICTCTDLSEIKTIFKYEQLCESNPVNDENDDGGGEVNPPVEQKCVPYAGTCPQNYSPCMAGKLII